MGLSEGIRKIGFRRWYERQLIESHLYLVSCFLCLVVVLACFEGFSLRMPAWESIMRLVAMTAGGAVCWWTLRRYLAMLDFAVHAAEHSVCGKCGAYSAIELSGPVTYRVAIQDEGEAGPQAVGVRCRMCGNEWVIR
jgi:protein-S-isoprenylcysteine O-methyltransferase Ste14